MGEKPGLTLINEINKTLDMTCTFYFKNEMQKMQNRCYTSEDEVPFESKIDRLIEILIQAYCDIMEIKEIGAVVATLKKDSETSSE